MWKRITVLCSLLVFVSSFGLIAQDEETPSECLPENLAIQQSAFQEFLTLDFEGDAEEALANLYRLGSAYQELAVTCGYAPNEAEAESLLNVVLSVIDFETIMAVNQIGTDVDALVAELEGVSGDPLNGQLLYNGLEVDLDGFALGCSGCHSGIAAPPTEGTWTRIENERLLDPDLVGYDGLRYLVESLVDPNAYIVEGYEADLMPQNLPTRLDIQKLADIIAFLQSQDQEES